MRSALIYNFWIEANLMASIAILLMIPLRRFFRKQLGNRAICFGWLLVAIRLLLPITLPNPWISSIRSPFGGDSAVRPIAGQVKARVIDAVSDAAVRFWVSGNKQGYGEMQKLASGIEYQGYPRILAWILLGGMAGVLAWLIFSNIRFRRKLRANRVSEISGELKEMYLELCRKRGVKPVPVYLTDPVPAACLVGVFRPYIVLPLMTAPQDAMNVLTHEICHLKNRDHLWAMLRLLCCVIHWFNPLVWLAASMSRTDCELRCDDQVTSGMGSEEKREYAGILVTAAAKKDLPGVGVMATGMTMTGKRLKNRVASILSDRRPLRWLATGFCLLAAICLVGAFSTRETNAEINQQMHFFNTDEAYHVIPEHDSRELPEDLAAYESGIWQMAGYDYAEMAPHRVESRGNGQIRAYYEDGGTGLNRYCIFAEDGTLLELQRLDDVPWLGGDYTDSTSYRSDEEYMQELTDWLLSFLATVNPGMESTIDIFQVQWEGKDENAVWMQIEGIPKAEDGEWITFVVQLAPTRQLQYFACISNG